MINKFDRIQLYRIRQFDAIEFQSIKRIINKGTIELEHNQGKTQSDKNKIKMLRKSQQLQTK